VKLQGTYIIPQINMKFSGNYTFNSGDTYTLRSTCVLVDDSCYRFNQGTNRIFGEPRGSRRIDDKNELDLRAEWFFHPGGGDGEIGLFVDVFNVMNDARVTSVETRAGGAFETPLTANQPRHYRLGARYTF
jgi:hypothetical protein